MPYQRPGVFVEEQPLAPNIVTLSASEAIGALIGTAVRGPIDTPVIVQSWGEYVSRFGSFQNPPTGMGMAAYQFFANGGTTLAALRIARPDATIATADISDGRLAQVGPPTVTAVAATLGLTASAISGGDWGNEYGVELVNLTTPVGSATTDTYEVRVTQFYANGTSTVVEKFTALSGVSTSPNYIVDRVNSAETGSKHIRLSNLRVPGGTALPVNAGVKRLTGGGDGTQSPTADTYGLKAALFDVIPSSLILFADVPTVAVANQLITYASARKDCFVVTSSETSTATAAQAMASADNLTQSAYGAIYHPWLSVPNPNRAFPVGSTLKVPPAPSVAGIMAQTDKLRGPYKTPAGLQAALNGVLAVQSRLTNAELDALNSRTSKPVNAIRSLPGAGICVMGGKTLDQRASDRYIAVRRSINYIRKEIESLAQFAIFEPNDEDLWEDLRVTIGTFLNSYWREGGLAGGTASQAYFVKCDGTLNTSATIAAGQVIVEVGVAVQYPAEFVIIRLGQFEGTTTSVEIVG